MRKAILFSVALGMISYQGFALDRHVDWRSSSPLKTEVPKMFEEQSTIRGVVRDANGPLAGVTVSVIGKSISVQTDANGAFSIEAATGDSLRFTSLGHAQQEVTVTSGTVNVTLQAEDTALDEVIVTAMGITREKKGLGYAVQDLGSEELMKNKTANIVNSLAGKIAGVNVTQTSGG